MSFWILYIIAFIPITIAGILYAKNPKQFTWQEWAVNTVICFAVAGVFHGCIAFNKTRDFETWSGQVTNVVRVPEWVEHYQIEHTETHTVGKVSYTTTWYSNHTEDHPEHWIANTDLPDLEIEISHPTFNEFKKKLGNTVSKVEGVRETSRLHSYMLSGDPLDYVTHNTTRIIIPVTNVYSFKNRVKAASTLFSFPPVPSSVKLPEYPVTEDPFKSERLVGSAVLLDLNQFDQMNTRLGYSKKVNVIMVGLNSASEMYGKYLESKWIGGKKNDLVIVYGGSNKSPTWVYAFSWTDKKTVLRMIEETVLNHGAINETLPKIEELIRKYYQIKNWHDFDYISIPLSGRCVTIYVIFVTISQALLMWWYSKNDITEYTLGSGRRYRSW